MDNSNAVNISPMVCYIHAWCFSNDRVCIRTKGNESSIRRIPRAQWEQSCIASNRGRKSQLYRRRKPLIQYVKSNAKMQYRHIKNEINSTIHTDFNPSKGSTYKCHWVYVNYISCNPGKPKVSFHQNLSKRDLIFRGSNRMTDLNMIFFD